MPQNKKDLILESFQKMDITMLEALLDDDKTYQDATKEVFLEKLNKAFSQLQDSGDTTLIQQKGYCGSERCENNGCGGYSFVGNHSKRHMDLIFLEQDAEISDIFHCNHFISGKEGLEDGGLVYVDIKADEKADFKPSSEFLTDRLVYKSAIKALEKHQDEIIDKGIYQNWLETRSWLFDTLNIFSAGEYRDSDNFYWMYYRMRELNDFLKYAEQAKAAVEEFQIIDENNETLLLRWLSEYEEVGESLSLFLFEDLDYDNPEASDYFMFNDFKISTADFKYIAKFKYLFDEYYWDKLKQYCNNEDEVESSVLLKRLAVAAKETHMRNSNEQYPLYVKVYQNAKYHFDDPLLESESEFVSYLEGIDWDEFLYGYLNFYFIEEFDEIQDKLTENRHNQLSLTYNLKRNGFEF